MNLHKILKYLAIVIGVIGLFFLGRVIYAGDEAIENSADLQGSIVDPFIFLGYVVFAVVLILVVLFVIKGIFAGNIKNTLISVGAFAVIVLISYFASSGSEITKNGELVISENGSHWVGAGLIAFYILAVIALGSMIFSGIKKLIK